MGLIYRLGLIIAGSYFEGAVRNSTQLVLYWAGQQDALQGFLPYLIPVFFGYVFALDSKSHWSMNRLKNDVMAYIGSTLLVGYPLLISLSLWFAGPEIDPTTSTIRIASTALFFVNSIIAVFVCRGAVTRGFPLSLPWGGVSGVTKQLSTQPSEQPESREQSSEVPLQVEEASETHEGIEAQEPQSETKADPDKPED